MPKVSQKSALHWDIFSLPNSETAISFFLSCIHWVKMNANLSQMFSSLMAALSQQLKETRHGSSKENANVFLHIGGLTCFFHQYEWVKFTLIQGSVSWRYQNYDHAVISKPFVDKYLFLDSPTLPSSVTQVIWHVLPWNSIASCISTF